jgi:hypothetical protein
MYAYRWIRNHLEEHTDTCLPKQSVYDAYRWVEGVVPGLVGIGLVSTAAQLPALLEPDNLFFWWDWGLNSGLHACKGGTLLLEPHLQSILLWLFWR